MKTLSLCALTTFILLIQECYQQTITCSSGTFYFELTGNCENCSTGCNTCTGFHEKDCQDCQPGINKIQIDNQFYCSKCPVGQYYDQISASCISCGVDCSVCLQASSCLICNQGYLLDANYIMCHTTLCMYGYFRNPITKTCDLCPSSNFGCNVTPVYDSKIRTLVVSYNLSAIKCNEGYQLYNSQCQCYLELYMKNKICQPCLDSNCTYCDSTGVCTRCKDGYYLQEGICVLICDQTLFYVSASTSYPYTYYCYRYTKQTSSSVIYSITTMSDKSLQCNEYSGYTQNYGCFVGSCRPHEFKLYTSQYNSYVCTKVCPVNSTINYSKMTCIRNECANDITYKTADTCFYRTCKLGTFFQDFISVTQKSQCATNYSQCYDQQEESSACQQCTPGYLFSYSSSICVTSCSNIYYYTSGNYCNSCNGTYMTTAQINTCLSNNHNLSFVAVAGGTQLLGSYNCPEGYTEDSTSTMCNRCTDTQLIQCDPTQIQYVCEWGENNQVKTCDPYDLKTLINQGFDEEGSLVTLSSSDCKVKNADGTCQVCNTSYNFNFFGVCSEGFSRSTKYYITYSNADSQYVVSVSCSQTQYVQRVYIGNNYMRLCKNFAYCASYIDATVDGNTVSLCDSCPIYFFNLDGNCIENCPNYTFKNIVNNRCETPIDNCGAYSSQTSSPLCSVCIQGYVRYQNGLTCILFSDCTNGLYINITSFQCLACPLGCDTCDSTGRCLSASDGYYLYNHVAIQTCPSRYFNSDVDRMCKECSQFCISCVDETTCLISQPGQYHYIFDAKVYYYLRPICQDNEYYDEVQNLCLPCDPLCAKCFKQSTKCILCSDPTYSLLSNNQCVKPCPNTYYSTPYKTENYTRLICKECDVSCLDSLCNQESTLCSTGCSLGYSEYQGRCYSSCQTGYESRSQKCYKICQQGEYNFDVDTCAPCKPECLECIQIAVCTKCKLPKIFDNKSATCVDTCTIPYFKNEATNECVDCRSRTCTQCTFSSENIGKCISCKSGFALNELFICMEQYVDDQPAVVRPDGEEDDDESKYVNAVITYTGKIYEGSQCHYSCKQCKGDQADDCLSCNLSTRVFYRGQYCICSDGYEEVGEQSKCVKQDKSQSQIVSTLSMIDLIVDWLLLLAISLDRIPLLTLQLIDVMQNASYAIYLESVFNYAGKFPSLQALYQSNFSRMIPNFIQKFFLKNFGVYKSKWIVSASEDDDRMELPVVFNRVSSEYILNAFPFLFMLAIVLCVLIILKLTNQQKYQLFWNRLLVVFYYLTFQDQLLFIGIQLKYISSLSSSALCIASLAGLVIALLFNLAMLTLAIRLELMSLSFSISQIQRFQLLYVSKAYFLGIFAKIINALSVVIVNQQIRIYLFSVVIVYTVAVHIFTAIKSLDKSSKYFFIAKIFIAIQMLLFILPVLLNESHTSKLFQTNKSYHHLQITLNIAIILQKIALFTLEITFLLAKYRLYNIKAGLIPFLEQQNTSLNSLYQQKDLETLSIELMKTLHTQQIEWKKK